MLNESEVLDFCNKVREIGGADILDSLLPGTPGQKNTCLIARNLNFNCRIMPLGSHNDPYSWVIEISDSNIATKIANEMELEYLYEGAIKLPLALAEVAIKFDNYSDVLYGKLEHDDIVNKDEFEYPWLLELSNDYKEAVSAEKQD